MNRLNWLAIGLWLAVGIYGVFYNLTYIDEAKYLIKGWLITTGQVGYYSTAEFFYQHMPGGLLWYGLGQRIFGPNLLVGRYQSFLIGLALLWVTFKLAKTINPKSANTILFLMMLAPVVTLYYSSAVPQSLAALTLTTGFLFLFQKKYSLSTLAFTLAVTVRENFLFTLGFYILFLFIYNRRIWLKNCLLSAVVLTVFFLPGWPGILNVLKNFPGISYLLPVTAAEKAVLDLNFQQDFHSAKLYFQALKELAEIYWAFGIMLIYSFWKVKISGKRFAFLIAVAGFNFLAHAWSAFNLSPRAIVPYFAYMFPLFAVVAAVNFSGRNVSRLAMVLLMVSAQITPQFASIFRNPDKQPMAKILSESVTSVRPILEDKKNIVWVAEPIVLYLAGGKSRYPLINSTNFYKPSTDTETIRQLGFWNGAMMAQWVEEADLVAVDSNRAEFVGLDREKWQMVNPDGRVWPETMEFFLPAANQ